MQTFLPFDDFELCAKVLDRQRLGKQRVECKQILRALHAGGGWKNHPAVKMWRGHSATLIRYYYAIVDEWIARGYKHNMVLDQVAFEAAKIETDLPYWLGIPVLHRSHRSMLVYKNPEHYTPIFERMGWDAAFSVLGGTGYWWPLPRADALLPVKAEIVSVNIDTEFAV